MKLTSHIQDHSVDWSEAARQYPSEVLDKWPTQEARDIPQSPWHHQLHVPSVDTSTLNTEQRAAYDIIRLHYEHLHTAAGNNPPPSHLIGSDSAGTGKSYLITAISHVLGQYLCANRKNRDGCFQYLWPNTTYCSPSSCPNLYIQRSKSSISDVTQGSILGPLLFIQFATLSISPLSYMI